MRTAMQELLSLIPSASEIKEFVIENDADEKMTDEWLWDRMYKGRGWIAKEKQQIQDAFNAGYQEGESDGKASTNNEDISNFDNAEQYYLRNYKNKAND